MSVPNNSLLSERIGFLAFLPPTALTAATVVVSSPYFSVLATNGNLFQRFFAAAQLNGTNGTGTVSIALYKASDTNGTGSATVSAALTYTGTASGVATNTSSVLMAGFDVNGTAFDTTKPFMSLQISGGISNTVSGIILAEDGRYDPASSYNAGRAVIVNAV